MEANTSSVEWSEIHEVPFGPESDLTMDTLCNCSEAGVVDRNTSVALINMGISPSLSDDLAEKDSEKIPS